MEVNTNYISQKTFYFNKGHKKWVLCIAWSPDGLKLASGSMDNEINIWNPVNGKKIGKTLKGHSKWITRY